VAVSGEYYLCIVQQQGQKNRMASGALMC